MTLPIEPIGDATSENPIDVAFEDGGHRCPPQRIKECRRIGVLDSFLFGLRIGQGLCIEFRWLQDGIEVHRVKVSKIEFVTHSRELDGVGLGQRMRKTLRIGMSDDDKMFHGNPSRSSRRV